MIVVTGATGPLGRLVIAELRERGVAADRIVAAVRSPEKAADLAASGVAVREADYDRPATLATALDGAERVLLISGNEIGRRVPQHRAVIDAAKAAGAGLLAYTSVLHADTTTIAVAPEHKETEAYLLASGLPCSLLRNGWYTENYAATVAQALATGVLPGAAGEGLVASAARADYAAAAAAVLTGEGHENTVYELSGDTAWSMAEFAATLTEVSGTKVEYRDLPADAYRAALVGNGVPDEVAAYLARLEADIADGTLAHTSGDLARLAGRPTTPLRDTLAALARA
ncbi:SDR family oxidoreductase [Streptomyces sp. PT12]|uniref:SDR family oxidoreductase n=1 Tax=Streptomyces sp. PT12 TaxID=1510197 RepID=UPI000DE249FA|nr:SDR family oxidoreductase [Streptomyces sp. PT12]RBM18536.1 NAD(P)-dependent oxidoreductase [Streptomyces sp. PT12]